MFQQQSITFTYEKKNEIKLVSLTLRYTRFPFVLSSKIPISILKSN